MTTMSNSQSQLITHERVSSPISSARWIGGSMPPGDQLTHYLTIGARSTRLSTFGPSPASESVLVRAHLTATPQNPVIKGMAAHRLSDYGKDLMKNLDPVQITHRSRPYGVMSSRLQITEFNRRWKKARENMDRLRSLSLPTSVAEELNQIKKQALLPRLKLDMEHIRKYQKEHKGRSIVPGLKWDQCPEDASFWSPIYNEVRAVMEEQVFSGKSFDTPFNLGGRQRTGANVEPDQVVYDIEESRTRVVCFHPALSTVFAFCPDKKGFYKEVLDGAKDVLEINKHVMCPIVDGGEVYGAAASALTDHEDVVIILGDDCNIYQDGKQYAFDGVNWETQVGTIMGEPFRGSKTYFGGMYHVPSGVFDTTIDDTLATMHVMANHPEMFEGIGVDGIMEREEMDERTNFMLGLSYNHDPSAPRLQGLKLTVDKADASHILPSGRNMELTNKHSPEEAEAWYLAYYGTTRDGGGLLDFLLDIPADEFRAGVMDQVIMQQETSDEQS